MTHQAVPCVTYPNLFLHPLLDESQPVPANRRREYAMLVQQASSLCSNCPMYEQCLTDAVTKFEVDGFVAGTTAKERQRIRKQLSYTPPTENFDLLAGLSNTGRTCDPHEIVRLREANPTEPLKAIAARAGCSISTVKRHLRRAARGELAPLESRHSEAPSTTEVLAAAASLTRRADDPQAA